MNESVSDGAECSRKVASGRRVAGVIRSLIDARVLHETLLVLVLMYGSETMLWKEKRSRIRAVQWDTLKDC